MVTVSYDTIRCLHEPSPPTPFIRSQRDFQNLRAGPVEADIEARVFVVPVLSLPMPRDKSRIVSGFFQFRQFRRHPLHFQERVEDFVVAVERRGRRGGEGLRLRRGVFTCRVLLRRRRAPLPPAGASCSAAGK